MLEKEYGYEYPIKAKYNGWDFKVRLMRKDEMPDDGEIYYCGEDGTIYKEGEPDFEVLATN
jgi:hypothetical protein